MKATDFPDQLAAVRADLAAAQAARHANEAEPVTLDQALGRLDQLLASRRSRVQAFGVDGLTAADGVYDPHFADAPLLHGDPADLLCWLFPDAIRERFAAALAAEYASGDAGITEAERLKRRTALAAKIRNLEVEEERIIRRAEDAGLELERREDADPRVVLARDLDLTRVAAA